MNTFEIRVTNTADDNDIATLEVERSSDDDDAQTVLDILTPNLKEDVHFGHCGQYVVIFEASDGEGYMYDVYESEESFETGGPSLNGGQCTGTLSDAIEMALES